MIMLPLLAVPFMIGAIAILIGIKRAKDLNRSFVMLVVSGIAAASALVFGWTIYWSIIFPVQNGRSWQQIIEIMSSPEYNHVLYLVVSIVTLAASGITYITLRSQSQTQTMTSATEEKPVAKPLTGGGVPVNVATGVIDLVGEKKVTFTIDEASVQSIAKVVADQLKLNISPIAEKPQEKKPKEMHDLIDIEEDSEPPPEISEIEPEEPEEDSEVPLVMHET